MKLLLGLFLVSAVGVGASPIAHFYSEGIRHVGDSQTHTFSQSSIRNDGLGVNIENERHSYTDNSLSMSHVDAPPGSVIVNGNNRLHRRPTGRNGAVIVNGQGNVIGPDVQGSDGLRLNHRAPRDIRIEDNRIDVTNLQTHGSAQIFIGHGRRQRDVVEPVNEQTENGREKRSYDYRNTNIQYNDRRVTMRNVQAGSGSVIVAGNGNSIGKRSVDTEPINGSPEETDKTREKRWSVGVKGRFSHAHNENISHKQHDIRAGDYAIITNGDGNQFHNRRKRLVESVSDQKVDSTTNIPTTRENVTETSETPETSTRQKRWFVRGSVKHSHTHTENRNHYQSNVRAGDYAIITNGDGNQFHNRRKRLVESVSAQDSSALTLEDPESLSRQRRWFVRASAKHDHTHNQNKNHHQSDVRAGDYAIITNGDGNHFHNRRRRSEDSVQTESEDTKRYKIFSGYLARSKRHFRGAVHIVDRRTRPGPQVSLDNLHGEGSVQIIIDDNTDPVTLRNARVIGSAQILIG